ncbi:MAG: hypothetical protein JWR21_3083 [Herminiimonas sp.]|nr:hypothetical protein [Herminiimonas sp.]
MRNTRLHELRTFHDESMPGVKALCMDLGTEQYGAVAPLSRTFHKGHQYRRTNADTTSSLQHCHASNVPVRQQAPSTNRLPSLVDHNGVQRHRVHLILLKLKWDILLQHKYLMPHGPRVFPQDVPTIDAQI